MKKHGRRSTCIFCGKKRNLPLMQKVFRMSWACNNGICNKNEEIKVALKIIKLYEKLTKINRMHIFGK